MQKTAFIVNLHLPHVLPFFPGRALAAWSKVERASSKIVVATDSTAVVTLLYCERDGVADDGERDLWTSGVSQWQKERCIVIAERSTLLGRGGFHSAGLVCALSSCRKFVERRGARHLLCQIDVVQNRPGIEEPLV
jgi:hypothetical protein